MIFHGLGDVGLGDVWGREGCEMASSQCEVCQMAQALAAGWCFSQGREAREAREGREKSANAGAKVASLPVTWNLTWGGVPVWTVFLLKGPGYVECFP